MKKAISILLALILVLALAACGDAAEPSGDDAGKPADTQIAPRQDDDDDDDEPADNTRAVLTVSYATEAELADADADEQCLADPDADPELLVAAALHTDVPMENLRLVRLRISETDVPYEFEVGRTVCAIEELEPDDPFICRMTFMDVPTMGILYDTADGSRLLAIAMSGEDGSLLLYSVSGGEDGRVLCEKLPETAA